MKEEHIHSCDPVLISTILEFKLQNLFKEVKCPNCASKMHHNKFISRDLKTSQQFPVPV